MRITTLCLPLMVDGVASDSLLRQHGELASRPRAVEPPQLCGFDSAQATAPCARPLGNDSALLEVAVAFTAITGDVAVEHRHDMLVVLCTAVTIAL